MLALGILALALAGAGAGWRWALGGPMLALKFLALALAGAGAGWRWRWPALGQPSLRPPVEAHNQGIRAFGYIFLGSYQPFRSGAFHE